MSIPEVYQRPDSWPHVFAKSGDLTFGDDGLPVQIHYCFHCQRVWKMGQEPRPVGACPARNDKKEMRRLLS